MHRPLVRSLVPLAVLAPLLGAAGGVGGADSLAEGSFAVPWNSSGTLTLEVPLYDGPPNLFSGVRLDLEVELGGGFAVENLGHFDTLATVQLLDAFLLADEAGQPLTSLVGSAVFLSALEHFDGQRDFRGPSSWRQETPGVLSTSVVLPAGPQWEASPARGRSTRLTLSALPTAGVAGVHPFALAGAQECAVTLRVTYL